MRMTMVTTTAHGEGVGSEAAAGGAAVHVAGVCRRRGSEITPPLFLHLPDRETIQLMFRAMIADPHHPPRRGLRLEPSRGTLSLRCVETVFCMAD